jgi:hypothetical protein
MPAYAAKEPDGLGVGKSAHPFAVTVEAKVPVSPDIVPSLETNEAECNRSRRLWNQVSRLPYYHGRCLVRDLF